MGMVPNLVTGVWVGGEDRAIHFEEIAYGQGATMALPIWAQFMKDVYTKPELGISTEDFEVPTNLNIELDCEKFKEKEGDNEKDELEDLEGFGF